MKGGIKRSAIPASGYMYQTLLGIKVLCDWLDTPTLYAWVKFEADDEEDARGLDDIVILRADGRMELTQVKFTVNEFEPNNALSWKWLTARKGRGTSLLEKWSSAAFRVGLERLGEVRLVTNRRPDATFAKHLVGGKVCWSSLPDALRQEIEQHVGGGQSAALFFDRFEFSHSYVGYESLEGVVSSALEARHTDHLGWLALFRRAIEWSIHKSAPAPDGRITLEVLRSTISERQPRPLDQEFRVPTGYLPPNPQTAQEFIEQAQVGAWDIRVLWGSPGQGKSTFLSYVCEQLHSRDVPVIRHHYFLDLQDASDRFSLKSVARSLMAQLNAEFAELVAHLNDRPEELRSWIAACGQACSAQGKRLVVVVDGLDHVWRENDEEISPLNELFAQLFPLPVGTTLILGTQRVSDKQLPRRMHRFVDPQDWVELPRMQLASVIVWLRAQYEAGTFQLSPEALADQQLARLSEAFHALSEGHPLVLTYSFMKLAHDHRVLTPTLVQQIDSAPHGDARAYYKALWQQLSWDARDALHLIAEDSFIWPAGALEQCLDLGDVNLESEIGHLLATVDAGLMAFHGSLYVFISQQAEHKKRLGVLGPRVEAWLGSQAPQYLHWAWLWLYESRRGEQSNLLAGTTRSWVLDALVSAAEVGQIVRILEAAEEVAFEAGDYETAIRKRALKRRVESGLAHQIDDADMLREYALRLTLDRYPTLLLASRASQSNLLALQQLSTLYLSLGQVDRACEVQERMRSKINDRIRAGTMKAREYEDAIERYLQVAAGTGKYEPKQVLNLLRKHRSAEELFDRFLVNASDAVDLERIMIFASLPMPVRLRRVLETQAVRVAGWARAGLHEWKDFRRFDKHPLSACWALLYDKQGSVRIPRRTAHPALKLETGSADDADFARYLHFVFFAAVANGLTLRGAPDPRGLGIETGRKWLSSMLQRLAVAAQQTAAVLARGDMPPVSLVYRLVVGERPIISDHMAWSDLRSIRKALVLITADVFLLTRLRSGASYVSAAEWAACRKSEFFALEHWRDVFLMRKYQLLDTNTVQAHIQEQAQAVRGTVGPFNEKARELADLCSWATAYDLSDLGRGLLEDTYRYGMGYGWRKDPGLSRLLEVVEKVAASEPSAALQAIGRLAPIYDQIDEMTEDSGARPSDLADLLLKLQPDTYVRYYRHWISRCEWYYADQVFATFAKHVDLKAPETAVALAFASGEETAHALRDRARTPEGADVASLIRLWDRKGLIGSGAEGGAHKDTEIDGIAAPNIKTLPMPSVEDFSPAKLSEFLSAVDATRQYASGPKVIQSWFTYWEGKGRGIEILSALEGVVKDGLKPLRGNELLDPAFHLSYRLQGSNKAFIWLVRAHQHRYGWSEDYYGDSDSERRLALIGRLYPQRWAEFLARSSLPVLRSPERGRAIPDAGLVRLLLEVGEVARAKSVLVTMIDTLLEEFDSQPLLPPVWWKESGT